MMRTLMRSIGTIGLKIGDNANLEAAVAYGHEYDSKPIGIGAKATFDLGDIDPHIAFDGMIPEERLRHSLGRRRRRQVESLRG